jgi:hypothetical protein
MTFRQLDHANPSDPVLTYERKGRLCDRTLAISKSRCVIEAGAVLISGTLFTRKINDTSMEDLSFIVKEHRRTYVLRVLPAALYDYVIKGYLGD